MSFVKETVADARNKNLKSKGESFVRRSFNFMYTFGTGISMQWAINKSVRI